MKRRLTKPAILQPTPATLMRLARIQGDDRCVLTVYFSGSLARGRMTKSRWAELPASMLPTESLTRDELEHRRRALELWEDVTPGVELPPAHGWVSVVSWMTEDAVFLQLPAAVEPAVHLDNSAFLLPAARLLDDFEACAVVYADHDRAMIYLAALGELKEEGRLRGEIKNHVRKGGWSQQRYERRRDKEIHHYCRAMLEKLKELVESEDLRRIVLAGDRILLNELEKRMVPDLRERVVARLALEDDKAPRDVFREVLSAAAEEEEREDRHLRKVISNEHAAGGAAVVGAADTLAALEEKRVRCLLIGPMTGVSFWRCSRCGAFGLGRESSCSDCGEATYQQSAANELMDLAFEGGSRVEFTSDELAEMDGVGALLRW